MKQINACRKLVFLFFCMTMASVTHAEDYKYQSPEKVEGTIATSVQEAKAQFDKGTIFIDVRNPRLYKKKHIPGAYHMDLKDGFNEAAIAAIAKKDQPIVIYCTGIKCARSYQACEKAVSWGYTKVYYFRGGSIEWRGAGYPVNIGTAR